QGGDELRGHFVRTKLAVGLTDRLAERVIAVLNGDESQADPAPGQVFSPVAPMALTPTYAEGSRTPTYAAPKARLPSSEPRASLAHSSYSGPGYATPPPVASQAASFHPEDAKAAAVRAYAAGRGVLSPTNASGLRRGSSAAHTPPPRFGAPPPPIVQGRSPSHVGAGASGGSAAWWSQRAAGLSTGASPIAAPARGSPSSVYGARRPTYPH
ncbi:hypothetical protein T492DRAFT_1077621, partial [Pavlovales sp. CCMP2436]